MTDDAQRRLSAALTFAREKHKGQYRIGGDEYITHPLAVSEMLREQGFGVDYQIAGLFHDLLEDTDASEQEIEALGGPEVLKAVKLLTKEPGYIMADYIAHIRENEIAFAVKAADRLHNLRSALAADEAFRRKYILETTQWFMDFSSQIPEALEALRRSLDKER